MSGLMDKAKSAIGNKENKEAQPGNAVEGTADNAANQQINNAANDAGVPQQADSTIDKAADAKINSDIPGGNN